ncbi:putative cytochrome b561 [Lingula anatina]|uniref:Cytochrome b561 n=1 Tax=Lingula anatina TaxID=7574 RepID=A0A1S3I2M8_LINAN|nr:putative cytochrome b561 [Lingula anatina]XP_013391600.1 putative cytochrome b561 [Lingula anatina]|eukprot:XP_013391599.1 putative cytochrome b561 [Lingula anatina]
MDYSTELNSRPRQPASSFIYFWLIFALSQALGVAFVVMLGVWLYKYQKGFAWTENPQVEFNYHPLFMVIGLVFLYGEGILVYRVFRNQRKIYIKVVHASVQAIAVIFIIVGLKAVFDSHNLVQYKIANLYSIHSWLGLATIILFGLQYIFGFVAFMYPKLGQNGREMLMPLHRYWGVAVYGLAIATSLMGMVEKIIFSVEDYSKKGKEAVLVNFICLVMVSAGLCVVYLVCRPEYKRIPLPEEQAVNEK